MQRIKHALLAAGAMSILPTLASAGDVMPLPLPDHGTQFCPDDDSGTNVHAEGQAIAIAPGGPGTPGVATRGEKLIQREKGAYLGISATPPPPVLRKQLDLFDGMGLVVDFIVPDSPAATAGLKEFDVLQKLDDQMLINPQQLAVLVRSHKPGDEIKLSVIRQGKPILITAKLIEHELEPLGDIERAQDQVAEQMRRMVPEAGVHPILPGNGPMQFRMLVNRANGSGAASLTLLEGDRSYTINTDHAGHKTFIVKDKDGKSVFEGLIDTPEQRAKIPDELKAKLDHMEQLTPKTDRGGEPKAVGPQTEPAN